MKNIVHVNSMGIKKWSEALSELEQLGKTLEFYDCSEVFIDNCNLSKDFVGNAHIRSFEVSFACENCDVYEAKMLITQDLDLENLPPQFTCPKCGQIMPLEEDDALVFLTGDI